MSARRTRPNDAPLLAWGDALRAKRQRRNFMAQNAAIVGVGIAAVMSTIVLSPTPRLVLNASASAPIGLYRVSPGAPIKRGDMVVAWLPLPYRQFAAARRYLPSNVPLVKRVVAAEGDEICALGSEIFLNGMPLAARRERDGKGRTMPMWSGCFRLHGGQLFLLMDNPASFDGRYFGPTDGADIIGKATLLWRR